MIFAVHRLLNYTSSLLAAGVRVCVYDAKAIPKARALFPHLVFSCDAYQAAERADALVILTDWDEFCLLNWQYIHDLMIRPLVVDGRNLLDRARMKSLGFEYHSVGQPD